jgi:hypothetical protein
MLRLLASNVAGHVQGLAQTEFKATTMDTDGDPSQDLESYFITGSTREKFGSAPTDASGVATLESGSKITDVESRFFVGHEWL